jgi:hypothetical protein
MAGMGTEKRGQGVFDVALETGAYAWVLTRAAGGLAYTKAVEVYTGKPAGDRPHISKEIERTLPVNEALVGKQFVEIGNMYDADNVPADEPHHEWLNKGKTYKRYGYGQIAKALRAADREEIHDHDIAQQTIDIAKEVSLDPAKLDDVLSEHEQEQVRQILEP